MTLLDSDTLSSLVKTSVPPRVAENLRDQREFRTSAVNVAEVLYGAEKAQSERLREIYETRVFPRLMVLPFDEAAARRYALLRADMEAAGTPLSEADLMVASVALVNGLKLITGNTRHFSRVPGLEIENWLD